MKFISYSPKSQAGIWKVVFFLFLGPQSPTRDPQHRAGRIGKRERLGGLHETASEPPTFHW